MKPEEISGNRAKQEALWNKKFPKKELSPEEMKQFVDTLESISYRGFPRMVKISIRNKFDMEGIIDYLYRISGRLPTEEECLRFHAFLQTFEGMPTQHECEDFLRLLGMIGR